MDERKIKVLMAIIHSYIKSPLPVGSRTLSKDYNLGVSSATIRNEMSDLEDLGYLVKLHTSSGRIPSDKAFRFYVNELLTKLDLEGQEALDEALASDPALDTEDFYESVAKRLADQTKAMVYIVAPTRRDTSIHLLDLILVGDRLLLLILVGNQGVVDRTLVPLDEEVSEEDLALIAQKLREDLVGLDFSQVKRLEVDLGEDLLPHRDLIKSLVEIVAQAAYKLGDTDLYGSGLVNLLAYEEFQDLSLAQDLLAYMSEKDNILRLMSQVPGGEDIHVVIGSEHEAEVLRTSSLLSTDYRVGSQDFGRIALMGPVRMDYGSLVKRLADISNALTNLLGGED